MPAATSSRRRWSWRRRPTPASCARSSSPRPCRSSPTTTSTTRWRRPTTRRSACAPRSGATTTALAADVASPAGGRHRLRQRPRHVGHRHVRADGRLEAVGLRGRARDRGDAGLRPPAGAGHAGPGRRRRRTSHDTWPSGAGPSSTARAAAPVRADVLIEGDRVAAIGPDAGGGRRDTVIDATGLLGHARASSTCTPTTTPSCSGTPTPAPRRCTA